MELKYIVSKRRLINHASYDLVVEWEDMIDQLKRIFLISDTLPINLAYIHTFLRNASTRILEKSMKVAPAPHNIFLCGRFVEWEHYTWMSPLGLPWIYVKPARD